MASTFLFQPNLREISLVLYYGQRVILGDIYRGVVFMIVLSYPPCVDIACWRVKVCRK